MKFFLYISMMVTVALPVHGVSLFHHYCGGNIINFELFEAHNKSCCEAAESSDTTCGSCEDRETTWSLDDFDLSVKGNTLSNQIFFVTTETLTDFVTLVTASNTLLTTFNEPPGWSGRHRSILNQSFLL